MAWSTREDAEAFLQAYACDNASGDSILHLAVRKDDLQLTQRLLAAGFPVDARNDDGMTPLHLAAELGLVDISQRLIAIGADILARQCAPAHESGSDVDSETSGVDNTSTHSDEDTSSPTAPRRLKSLQQRKPPSPFDVAFNRGDGRLVELFIKHYLPSAMEALDEYTMLEFMAKAFVAKWESVLEAFREAGWELDREHSGIERSFLFYVCEQAEDAGPVELLLKSGADATGADLGGATVLHVAAQRGPCSDGSVVKCLIAAGAKVDVEDRVLNGTPLMAAIQGQKLENVRVLLEAGSDVNHTIRRDGMRRTVLHIAAQDGIPKMIQLLLDHGANPNILDERGGTPARWAIRNNYVEAVRILLEGGLDPNLDKESLRLAIEKGRLRIMELFIQHGAVVERRVVHLARVRHNGNQMRLFELCVKNMASGDEDSGDENGSDENSIDKDTTNDNEGGVELNEGDHGSSRVHVRLDSFSIPMMMMNGEPDVYRLCAVLVEHGHGKGLENVEDVPRALLICICAEHGYMNGISRLLASGKITSTTRRFRVRPFGWTAMHVAAFFGHTAVVEELWSNGWGLADEDSSGRSVLDIAASCGHVELVRTLLAVHCIAEHRDRDGQTPLHYAMSGPGGRDCRLLEILVEAGCGVSKASASGETALHRAARFNYDTAASWLLEKGSTVSATDGFLNTPLHIAACFNAVSVIKILLAHGAQINRAAVDRRTPLHCASQAGAGDAVAALLNAGGDPNKTESQGNTVLATAIHWGACKPHTINALFARTNVDWTAPRQSHLVVTATLAVKTPHRAATLGRVINSMRAATGANKTRRLIKRMLPELVPEMLVSADDADRGSPADVIPLLLDFLPENGQTRHIALFYMLLAVIKHGGDDEGHLTRRLLLLDESNVTQAIPGNWGLQHLCCRYGRVKQLRVFLGLGLSPFSRSVIDGETCTPQDVARKFSPGMVALFESLIEGMHVLGGVCRRDRTIFPLLRKVLGPEHFERVVVDLSDAFKQGSEEEED
ncbi:hypothetical protein MFIFM68171_05679 [Madurella fahalii]|uniref:Ankyrin repeat protein n=1 Tax=Madurella fahalii TaxID=1157608 RepID=A0ABQ0GCM2_9PEZI